MRRGLIALALLLVLTPSALADGDPANDVLLVKNVFLPYPAPSAAASNELAAAVSSAYARGYRVKVAVIATETDLGSVPSLFNRPGDYARFLGQELNLYYVGPLLIVMPAGYGVYDGGRSTAPEPARRRAPERFRPERPHDERGRNRPAARGGGRAQAEGHQGPVRQRARSVGHARQDGAPELRRVRRQRQDARANGGS